MSNDFMSNPQEITQFSVYVTEPSNPIGYEMDKRRPYIVISPTHLNNQLGTVIVAPMTRTDKPYITRVPCMFQGKGSYVVLDQLMRVDKSRLIVFIGEIEVSIRRKVIERLNNMFS